MAVRRAHHRDLDALVAQSGDAPRPLSFDRGSPFELQAELGEERDGGIEGLHHDADVVHPYERHAASPVPSLRRGAYSTLANGQSDSSHSLTARQSGVSRCAWLSRTQESAQAS